MTPSTMLPLGTVAPAFTLSDTEGRRVSLADFKDSRAMLVMFICNHCPFVKHVQNELAALTTEYVARGVGIVGISSNDVESYPDDRPEQMTREKARVGYTFPYLFDGSQQTAKDYHAACTPDFFVFDASRKLIYRGQMDDSRPGNGIPVTGKDLREALDRALAGKPPLETQRPSIGCNIKWRKGNAPDYFG